MDPLTVYFVGLVAHICVTNREPCQSQEIAPRAVLMQSAGHEPKLVVSCRDLEPEPGDCRGEDREFRIRGKRLLLPGAGSLQRPRVLAGFRVAELTKVAHTCSPLRLRRDVTDGTITTDFAAYADYGGGTLDGCAFYERPAEFPDAKLGAMCIPKVVVYEVDLTEPFAIRDARSPAAPVVTVKPTAKVTIRNVASDSHDEHWQSYRPLFTVDCPLAEPKNNQKQPPCKGSGYAECTIPGERVHLTAACSNTQYP